MQCMNVEPHFIFEPKLKVRFRRLLPYYTRISIIFVQVYLFIYLLGMCFKGMSLE